MRLNKKSSMQRQALKIFWYTACVPWHISSRIIELYDTIGSSSHTFVVYHIRANKDADDFTKGYIGVSTNFQRCRRQHQHRLNRGTHNNSKLQRGWNANIGNVKMVVIARYNTDNEMRNRELQLRPQANIGWNIRKGGR